ncbi:MAG: tetratricopeptide repeat protein [Pirellulales bacterium]
MRSRTVVAALLLAGLMLPLSAGCATFGRRGPLAEKAAACRDLSQQGVSAMEAGQWQRAELLLRQAIEASPDDVEAHRHLAEALWHRGASREAMSHIAAALHARPTDARLAVRAGEMSLALGGRDAALIHAEQAIRLDPQLAAAWALRGRVFWQLQHPERALADLGRALEFTPDNPDVLLDLATMYRARGQAARCLTTLHHLQDTYPSGQEPQAVLMLEGLTLLDLGRPHQACESFLAASRRGPASTDVLYHLAQAHSAAGRYTEATAAAQQALAIDASHQPSRQLLTELATRTPPNEPQRR